MITQSRLKQLLDYDPETGVFKWRESNSNRAPVGSVVRGLSRGGYLRARLDGRLYYCHRLAWLYVYAKWPSEHLDHVNHNRSDNRLCNLREASNSENMQNRAGPTVRSTTGTLGVGVMPGGRFRAQIVVEGKNTYLGCFDSVEDAESAYLAAKARLHPFSTMAARGTVDETIAERLVLKRGVQDATMDSLAHKPHV
jgi:hypothetical protein